MRQLNFLGKPNKIGIVSVSLSVLFWVYADSSFGPNTLMGGVYVEFVLLFALPIGATIAAIIAVVGSKWWLLALIGPLSAVMLMLSAST